MEYNKKQNQSHQSQSTSLKGGEKAYVLLSRQENISVRKAKELIDRGVVYAHGKKITIARALISPQTKFKVERPANVEVVFEDARCQIVNKPPFLTAEEVEKIQGYQLIHRLDKETSGVLLLAKTEEFRQQAIQEFKAKRVYKEYVTLVEGLIAENMRIDRPIKTIKKGGKAFSKADRNGENAVTLIEPLTIIGQKTKLKVVIETGKTHQIRAHLAFIGTPIVGDTAYGSTANAKRVMLHAKRVKFLDIDVSVDEPKEFNLS